MSILIRTKLAERVSSPEVDCAGRQVCNLTCSLTKRLTASYSEVGVSISLLAGRVVGKTPSLLVWL